MRLVYRARAVLSSGRGILFFGYFVTFLSTSLLLYETRRVFFVTKQDCEVRFIILAQKLAENSLGGFVVETETRTVCYNRDMAEVSSSAHAGESSRPRPLYAFGNPSTCSFIGDNTASCLQRVETTDRR